LQELGLEKGWGNTAGRVLETIRMLEDLLQAPDPDTLEKFLARIPMVFSVVIVSPHGYFGQDAVLGLPDTGGQVCVPHARFCHFFPSHRAIFCNLTMALSVLVWSLGGLHFGPSKSSGE
jgi:hypothetical protein